MGGSFSGAVVIAVQVGGAGFVFSCGARAVLVVDGVAAAGDGDTAAAAAVFCVTNEVIVIVEMAATRVFVSVLIDAVVFIRLIYVVLIFLILVYYPIRYN